MLAPSLADQIEDGHVKDSYLNGRSHFFRIRSKLLSWLAISEWRRNRRLEQLSWLLPTVSAFVEARDNAFGATIISHERACHPTGSSLQKVAKLEKATLRKRWKSDVSVRWRGQKMSKINSERTPINEDRAAAFDVSEPEEKYFEKR